MLDPQDLPGRYGRVIHALDHILQAIGGEAVVAGGWAVWRHGYLGRVTQDVDIVVAAENLDELLRVAAVHGFEVPARRRGLWPKLHHKETGVDVDILPENAVPGTASQPAPTTIPHPAVGGPSRASHLHPSAGLGRTQAGRRPAPRRQRRGRTRAGQSRPRRRHPRAPRHRASPVRRAIRLSCRPCTRSDRAVMPAGRLPGPPL